MSDRQLVTGGGLTTRLDDLLSRLSAALTTDSERTLRTILETEPEAIWNLRLTRANEILDSEQCECVDALAQDHPPVRRTLRTQTVVILKATRLCNLRCTYCNSWREGPGNIMPFEVLARVIRDALRTPGIQQVDFVWHGGEVTLLPIDYLKKAVWLQQKFVAANTQVFNSIQTNATRITKEWIDFLKSYGFSVGVSIDGPPEIHDARRLTVGGRGSWKDVRKGLDQIREAGIPFGALAVIDECALQYGARKYLEYLVSLGVRAVALLNAIPPNLAAQGDEVSYLPWQQYTQFLRDLFHAWWTDFRSDITIRELDALVETVQKGETSLCVFRDNCMGQYLTIEPNGDVSACDKYVGDPKYLFGNVLTEEINEMLAGSQTLRMALFDVNEKKTRMQSCPNFKLCFGGCPHDVRLSEKYIAGWSPSCCGLSTLIDDIRKVAGTVSATDR